MYLVNADEAEQRLRELIAAALRGEMVLITTDEQRSVQIVPVVTTHTGRHFGSAKGLITVSDDFDDPLHDFDDYTR